jgi:hypothetical protein
VRKALDALDWDDVRYAQGERLTLADVRASMARRL